MAKTEGDDLQKRGRPSDKVKAHEAVDSVRRLLKAEAVRYWKENPLIVGGDEPYRPVDEGNNGDTNEG